MGKNCMLRIALCGLGATFLVPSVANAQQDRVSATDKGSLLIFSKVEIRWDAAGNIIQDTFIDISNDFPQDVQVLLYFVNGDAPLPACATCGPGGGFERQHPGWNWVDNQIKLTKNEPTYWSAFTGLPKGVSPFTVLDPANGGLPGRPDPAGSGERVLRGYVLAWAINQDGVEIRWNHLKGDATIVNYMLSTAWEYNAWAFQVVSAAANGAVTGTPGVLNLNGIEYAQGFDELIMDFYACGSGAFSGGNPFQLVIIETDLTLHPITADLRQESGGPVCTKAHFDIWNENEVKFSGTFRCICCWDQTLLCDYDIPNHFLLNNLQSDKGRARIDGQESILCDDFGPNETVDASLLGVVAKHLNFQFGASYAAAGTNLFGLGTESGVISYDIVGPPDEQTNPNELLNELLGGPLSGRSTR